MGSVVTSLACRPEPNVVGTGLIESHIEAQEGAVGNITAGNTGAGVGYRFHGIYTEVPDLRPVVIAAAGLGTVVKGVHFHQPIGTLHESNAGSGSRGGR